MRRSVLSLLVLAQTFAPTIAVAATPAAPVAQAPIFIAEPLPEISARHAAQESFEGHQKYHQWMQDEIRTWEQDWKKRTVTPPYTQEKRVLLKYMLSEHRQAHMEKKAPARSLVTHTDDTTGTPDVPPTTPDAPSADDELKPTGRAALFTPLPKMSPRLLEARQNKLFGNK